MKIPDGAPPASKDIKALFLAAELSELLDGRLSTKRRNMATILPTEKVAFVDKAVRPQSSTIDFSGFDTLLECLAPCVADYAIRSAPFAVVPKAPTVAVGAPYAYCFATQT